MITQIFTIPLTRKKKKKEKKTREETGKTFESRLQSLPSLPPYLFQFHFLERNIDASP